MITAAQHGLLRQFFAGFFHQDWRVEAETPEGVVTHYATQINDYAALPALAEAILALIAETRDEDELATRLWREFGCYYAPKAIGASTKEWLLHIAERVRAEERARRGIASPFLHGSRSRLTRRDRGRFPGPTLFDAIGRAVCEAECLPRRELYESWEVARRVRRRFRGGRVVDLACGHGLVAHLMLLLDDTSSSALAVDPRPTPSSAPLAAALVSAWPRLAGRVTMEARAITAVALDAGDVVVAAHACGHLTDEVIDGAVAARARLALLPCCHDEETCDAGGLRGWMDLALAIDATRVARLRAEGYAVTTQTIPRAITAKNRLLLADPRAAGR